MKPTRRHLLQAGAASALGLWLARARAEGEPQKAAPVAKSLIVLWMNGGASHVDTFDPKTGKDGGPFRAIATRAPGLSICEHLPQVAEQAHHIAVLRGMTSKEGNHERARFFGHTGYAPNPTVQHPGLGAWVSAERGKKGNLPTFMSIGGPSQGGGFLGIEHAPFVMRSAGSPPDNVARDAGLDESHFSRRLAGLDFLESQFQQRTKDQAVASRREIYQRATSMMRARELDAFDLAKEPEATRRAYGDSDFGRGCLLARRLVESGVSVVEVTQSGWDTHFDGFEREKKLMGDLDPAMATLLRDLDERELLESTLVLWMGDFGRSPGINARDGRDHYPKAWSTVVAGGGVRGGIVHGATDATGASVVAKPVTVPDLFATVATQLGLDPTRSVNTPAGRPIMLTDHGIPIHDILT